MMKFVNQTKEDASDTKILNDLHRKGYREITLIKKNGNRDVRLTDIGKVEEITVATEENCQSEAEVITNRPKLATTESEFEKVEKKNASLKSELQGTNKENALLKSKIKELEIENASLREKLKKSLASKESAVIGNIPAPPPPPPPTLSYSFSRENLGSGLPKKIKNKNNGEVDLFDLAKQAKIARDKLKSCQKATNSETVTITSSSSTENLDGTVLAKASFFGVALKKNPITYANISNAPQRPK